MQFLSVSTQLLVDPVLETLHHGRTTAKYCVLHHLLPQVLSAFLKTSFDHFGQTFVLINVFEKDLTGRINQLLGQFND